MRPWDFPPEYGIEPGERCDRGRCKGRMIVEEVPTEETVLDDGDEPVECTRSHTTVVVCGVCGEGNDD